MKLNGQQLIKDACKLLNINLVDLVAATTIWAHPDSVNLLRSLHVNPNALWKFNIRRHFHTETRRVISEVDGCYLDENTEANKAIKIVTGNIAEAGTFHVCHIYEGSCYEKDYHLSIPNLVLIPKEIATLTDHDHNVKEALKYRSYELYNFHYQTIPIKPIGYDKLFWRKPTPFTLDIKESILSRRKLYYGN